MLRAPYPPHRGARPAKLLYRYLFRRPHDLVPRPPPELEDVRRAHGGVRTGNDRPSPAGAAFAAALAAIRTPDPRSGHAHESSHDEPISGGCHQPRKLGFETLLGVF